MKLKRFLPAAAAFVLMITFSATGASASENTADAGQGALTPVHVTTDTAYESLDTGEERWDWISCDSLSLDEADAAAYPMLAASLGAFSEETGKTLQNDSSDIMDAVKEFAPEEMLFSEAKMDVVRADSRIVSILVNRSSHMGGAHPSSWYECENLSAETGAKLELSDVLNDPEALPGILAAEILKTVDNDMIIVEDVEKTVREEMDPSSEFGPLCFTLSYDGITFWLSPYEFTAFAAGPYAVKLPFETYPSLVKGEYQEVPDNYFLKVGERETVTLPGGKDYFTWYLGEGEEYDDRDLHLVSAAHGENGSEAGIPDIVSSESSADTVFTIMSFSQDTYIMYVDGKTFFVFEALTENDYRDLHIYDLTDPKAPKELPVISRRFEKGTPTDPKKVYLGCKTDILSSYTAGRYFSFNADGTVTPLSDWDDVLYYGEPFTLTVKHVVYLPQVDGETLEAKEEIMVPAGTQLSFVRTDSENTVDMRMDDGTVVRITQEGDGWPYTVQGIELDDLFDGMMFAG